MIFPYFHDIYKHILALVHKLRIYLTVTKEREERGRLHL